MPEAPKKRSRPWVKLKVKHARSIDMSWFYNDRRWRKFSANYKKGKNCLECEKNGVVTPAQVTDHLVRYVDGGEGFDLDNLKDKDFQPLCNEHHNSKSGKEAHGYKRGMG